MASFVTLRGYAAPFLQAERCSGRLEYIEPGAFDAMLTGPHNVFLNFAVHDAEPLARQISFHIDDYGLGFSVAISKSLWNELRPWIIGGYEFASINIVDESADLVRHDDTIYRRIKRARIDHVTITNDRAVYKGTGIWPAKVVGEMPPRLARLATNWDAGRCAFMARKKAADADAAKRRKAQSREARLAAYLAPRQQHYAQVRQRVESAVASGRVPSGFLFMHVALAMGNWREDGVR